MSPYLDAWLIEFDIATSIFKYSVATNCNTYYTAS